MTSFWIGHVLLPYLRFQTLERRPAVITSFRLALALFLIPVLPAQRTDPLAGLPANPLHGQRQQNKLAKNVVELHAIAFVETHFRLAAVDFFFIAIPFGYRPIIQRE